MTSGRADANIRNKCRCQQQVCAYFRVAAVLPGLCTPRVKQNSARASHTCERLCLGVRERVYCARSLTLLSLSSAQCLHHTNARKQIYLLPLCCVFAFCSSAVLHTQTHKRTHLQNRSTEARGAVTDASYRVCESYLCVCASRWLCLFGANSLSISLAAMGKRDITSPK